MGFRVIIVGGSVTGLSLANMLEKHGIDYVLLEAYREIAPQVGASIGMASNGLRILDQLGCYERLQEMAGNYYLKAEMRDLEGRVLYRSDGKGQADLFEIATGYPVIFLDRQMLLQVLYDMIEHKDRILTGKRVARLEMSDGELARVHTKDGSVYEGDIVVGADGVHSATRSEMWRLADELAPGTFTANEEAGKSRRYVKANAKCIFGISTRPPGFPSTKQQFISSKGVSYMTSPGPDSRLYWFLFVSMPTASGKAIPKWTKKDEELLAEQHLHDKITDQVSFGDLYKARRKTALVSLEEHVFLRWHFKRAITIGDSAHKVHPITVVGGNGAIESAALLCNALVRRLPENRSSTITEPEIQEAFTEVQDYQQHRTQSIVKEGKQMQAWLNQTFPLAGLAMRLASPFLNDGFFTERIIKVYSSAPTLERLALPVRLPPALPQTQVSRSGFSIVCKLFSAAILLGAIGYAVTWKRIPLSWLC